MLFSIDVKGLLLKNCPENLAKSFKFSSFKMHVSNLKKTFEDFLYLLYFQMVQKVQE